jgi:hypothetical protein
MANLPKSKVLAELRQRYGEVPKVKGSQSLFTLADGAVRVYFRYSRVHERGRTFFGLRQVDLRRLEGHNSFLCFLVDDGSPPVIVPYADFEEVFRGAEPARDGQYKAQLITRGGALELYVAKQGRFNVEGYVGYEALSRAMEAEAPSEARNLSHSQIQTLLADIGRLKGYHVHVPEADLGKLDWSLAERFSLRADIPPGFDKVGAVLSQVDVVWIGADRPTVEALYEVEHSTPIYSGLLRLNDVLLTDPRVSRFSIVSNEGRRELFSRQVFRPTFTKSGLAELCSFLEYSNVISWHQRLERGTER